MDARAENLNTIVDTASNLVYPLKGIHIDVKQFQNDLRQMEEHFWIPQNRYKADITHWDGISVYSISGDAQDLRCADRLPVRKTAAGEKCSYICNELLPQFGAPWLRVVFYRLKAGTQLGEHRDLRENRVTPGIIRIHIPVVTNERVLMYVNGQRYHFPVGTAWYFDPTARHRVENNSDQDRIHLVIDFKLCKSLDELLKPLTINDRLRFLYLRALSDVLTVKTFFKFIWTSEGRARIGARAAQVFHLDRRG